jgi:hypothetical protein
MTTSWRLALSSPKEKKGGQLQARLSEGRTLPQQTLEFGLWEIELAPGFATLSRGDCFSQNCDVRVCAGPPDLLP